MAELKGKTAIVTGSNRGIGYEVIKKFAENGANIFACARKYNEAFEKSMNELSKCFKVDIVPIYFDLEDSEGITQGIRKINGYRRNIDILVNCAGIADGTSLNQTSLNRLKTVYQVNFFSQIQLIQLVSRMMIRQKSGGSIINFGSVGGIEANPGYLSYGSSKAAIMWATRCISKELGQYGIRVNAVSPGMTKTDMGGAFKTEEELNTVIKRTALKRLGEPPEIADAVLFLASDKSSFISGEILQVDGGRV